MYATTFESQRAGNALLDLGDVRYACTVRLNGRMVEKKFWGPYKFNIPLRKGPNKLEIIVTNTLANALANPEVPKRWLKQLGHISSYENKQRAFEKDSLSSGLLGPVSICFGQMTEMQ